MSTRFIFWLLMILWLIFALIIPSVNHFVWSWGFGGSILEFVLFGLLGWKVFGQPITNG